MKAIRFIGGILALGLLAQAQPSAPPAAKTSVAIYPIKAAGATDKAVASALSALLSSELTPSTKLYVIEEAMLKAVMERQGMNASDACDDTSCQVEVGKLVKAQKMIIGDVVKLGSLYILSLKLVDIQTGPIEFSTKDQCACADEQLPDLVAVAAAKIRNHFGENLPVPSLPQGAPASPQGAQAFLNAQPFAAPPANSKFKPMGGRLAEMEKMSQDMNTQLNKAMEDMKNAPPAPPIAKAVQTNDLAQVQQLLAQDPSQIQYQDGAKSNLLFYAISPEMANFLIGKGLSISKNSFGQTPILIVGVVGLNKKMVEFYISQGADVNEDNGGETLLGLALFYEKNPSLPADKRAQAKEIADLLRQHGAKKGHKF